MKSSRVLLTGMMLAALTIACGCGRPTRPGGYFEGEKVDTSIVSKSDTPLPEKPFFEVGPEDAKVRILAFFPIDERHQEVIALLKGLASQYPGKVYLKYVDPRTPEGKDLMDRSRMPSYGLMINGASEIVIERRRPGQASPQTGPPERERSVEFVQDIGRYWTAEDLRAAVAQTVRQAYGPSASGRPSGGRW